MQHLITHKVCLKRNVSTKQSISVMNNRYTETHLSESTKLCHENKCHLRIHVFPRGSLPIYLSRESDRDQTTVDRRAKDKDMTP